MREKERTMADLVELKTFNSRAEAEMAKAYLEAEGIETMVQADDCGGMRPFMLTGAGGVRLMVHEEDAGRALLILEAVAADPGDAWKEGAE